MEVVFVNRRLAFGSAITTDRDVQRLQALGVTHVMILCHTWNRKPEKLPNLRLKFKDDKKPRPAWFFRTALQFYRKCMSKPGAKLYVMCRQGRCRSASMVYFFLRFEGYGSRKAENAVYRARPRARLVPAYLDSGEKFLKQ